MSDDLETRDIRAFMMVAEELHFSAAAKRLGMAQPALSQQIRRLEQSIGIRLFERTTRTVELTAAGRLLLTRCSVAISQIESGLRAARLVASGAEGHLSIGFVQAAIYRNLSQAVRAFSVRFPDTSLEVNHMGSPDQIQALRAGRLDMGIIRPPMNSDGLQMEVIAREGFGVVLPSSHHLAREASIRLADLAQEKFIHYRSAIGDAFPQVVAPYCRSAGFEPRITQETTTTPSTLCLVAAGAGVAIVPDWVRNVAPPGVAFCALPEMPALVELAAAWVPETAPLSVMVLVDLLRTGLANALPALPGS